MQLDDKRRPNHRFLSPLMLATLALFAANGARGADNADTSDPLLNLFIQKGYVSKEEAEKVKAEADYARTNGIAASMPPSKWIFGKAVKNVEIFGDIRVRYEVRDATAPGGDEVELDRIRYALRFGLRGDLLDDFYYGIRFDTSPNPRSSWVTLGTSSGYSVVSQGSSTPNYSGTVNPYQGPYGKSTDGLGVGQVYLGWRFQDWMDLTFGKMPNPLYTTPMVWSPTLNPEGLAERFKYQVGNAEFFANFGQFVYEDTNPEYATTGLFYSSGISDKPLFMLAWQVGMNYDINKKVSAKAAATVYHYLGLQTGVAPYFGDTYIGEGAYTPGGAFPYQGQSGYGTSSTQAGYPSLNYPNNQVGLNNLLVVEVPFEVNVKFNKFDLRGFGDVAYNLDGRRRAEAAAVGYSVYTGSPFAAQTDDVMAYQLGVAVGSHRGLGEVYGTTAEKHGWEFRTYWQHVEQYALDPNLPDTDFFEGSENLEGIYVALAYSPFANVTATVRYGYASRINNKLGTGGSGQDIPQINPINEFSLLQMDLGVKF